MEILLLLIDWRYGLELGWLYSMQQACSSKASKNWARRYVRPNFQTLRPTPPAGPRVFIDLI